MYGGIGVEDRDAQVPKKVRRGGFAHGDGAGQPDDNARPAPHTAVTAEAARFLGVLNPPQGHVLSVRV
jgi:hypothetical protein